MGLTNARSNASVTEEERQHAPSGEEHERKHRVLSRGTPSITRTIADAVVLKHHDLFLLTEPDGRIPVEGEHGLGLYYNDCRYLKAYELRLAGASPVALGAGVGDQGAGKFQLTTTDLRSGETTIVEKEELSIAWERRLDGDALVLSDRLAFRNWHHETLEVPIELRFDSAFEDIFQVRGLLRERLGTLHPPEWRGGRLRFSYDGRDGVSRRLEVALSPGFEPAGPSSASTIVRLAPRGSTELSVTISIRESTPWRDSNPAPGSGDDTSHRLSLRVRSDSLELTEVLQCAARDLNLLQSSMDGLAYYAAGIPWFATLFGRDSIIAALEVLPFHPVMAAETLRLLARHQGERTDPWRDEHPGKILHELRRGEMSRAGMIPHTPYYGTVDATPLFLILLARYSRWTGDLDLFHELRAHADRALEWMRRYGDGDGDGYIEYRSSSEHGLINQGWKDSGDAIVDERGRIATPPIALVEVQAYAYQARLSMADLYRRAGDQPTADRLTREAEGLRERFNRDFWVDRIGYYALALAADKRPLGVYSSNPGHALWCGIADPDKAAATVERLVAEDMYSGWGVRTLAGSERGYTPIGYHLGTVWPHDNAIIAAGCRRYGFDEAAHRIAAGIIAAALHFQHARLPELFTGFPRSESRSPIRYPVACHPQAWAAGAVPYLLQTMLGLEADGFARRLHVIRPLLPAGTDHLELEGIAVAGAAVDLRFARRRDGSVAVETVGGDGGIEVVA